MSDKCVYNTTFGNVKFELLTNGDSSSYQDLKLYDDVFHKLVVPIAPVDYFTVLNGLVYAKDLKEFLQMVNDIWTIAELNSAVKVMFDLE